MEKDGVLIDVLKEILTRSLTVGIELNRAVFVVEIELCVQCVIVLARIEVIFFACIRQ